MPPTPPATDWPERRCSRRSMLRTGLFGGGAATVLAVAGTGTGAPAAAAAQTPAAAPAPTENLFTVADLDFDTLFAFGGTGYGSAEFGELVRAVDEINTAGASYQTYYGTFLALAQRTAAQAGEDLAAGQRPSARSGYLRAASYYDLCLYFILGTTARAREASA